jgi:hypothetical protein
MNTKDQVRSTEEAFSTERALDLALEVLEICEERGYIPVRLTREAITAIRQARSAPYVASPRVQGQAAFNAGVPLLYPEMKDGETISVEYTTPPGGRQSEDCLTAAPVREPDYAWPTIADYEKEVGFAVNDTFKAAWQMARATNDLFKRMVNVT